MSERRRRPDLPTGIGSASAFGEIVGWGRGNDMARARAATITREEVWGIGLTFDIAQQWRDFYVNESLRNPANPSAAGRIELMERILELIESAQ